MHWIDFTTPGLSLLSYRFPSAENKLNENTDGMEKA